MPHRIRWLRRIVLLTLLLQPVGAGAVRLWHMPQEARGLGHVEHISAPGEGACVPHSHDSCRICRTVHDVPLTSMGESRLSIQSTAYRLLSVVSPIVLSARRTVLPVGSRAPPQV
jgi:hypothetical protein